MNGINCSIMSQSEKIGLLTEIRSIFMLAMQGGCKNTEKQFPKLSVIKKELDFSHGEFR